MNSQVLQNWLWIMQAIVWIVIASRLFQMEHWWAVVFLAVAYLCCSQVKQVNKSKKKKPAKRLTRKLR